MSEALRGEVAWVTGSDRGIGRAIALRLADAGARVVVSSRSADEIGAVASQIKDRRGDALALPCDVTSVSDVADLVERARSSSTPTSRPRCLHSKRVAPPVEAYQDVAYESLSWFENMHAYQHLEPLALAYSLMTRSRKIDRDKLRMRDPGFVARYEALRGPS